MWDLSAFKCPEQCVIEQINMGSKCPEQRIIEQINVGFKYI